MKNRRDMLVKLIEREMRFFDIRELARTAQKRLPRQRKDGQLLRHHSGIVVAPMRH